MLNVEPTECLQRLSDSVVEAAGPLYDKEHFTCPAWVDTLPEDARVVKTIGDEVMLMAQDVQALTDNAEHPEKVRQNILQVALDYLACGIDPAKSCIFSP